MIKSFITISRTCLQLASVMLITHCVSALPAPQQEDVSMTQHATDHNAIWYRGPVEEAFAQAKREKKPLFLYWGAVWCPPCNELKAEVLNKPRFAELMAPFIAVYLDGDADSAQIWGDKLKISGYPTMIVFDTEGHEVVRLGESLNIDEFAMAITGALGRLETLPTTLARVLAGQGSDQDWKLIAYASWESSSGTAPDVGKLLASCEQLIHVIPDHLPREKALLAAQILQSAYNNREEHELQAQVAAVKNQGAYYLDAIFANKDAIMASRNFVTQGSELIEWLYPSTKDASSQHYQSLWLSAASLIENAPDMPIDLRLYALYPSLQFYQLEHKGESKEKSQQSKPSPALVARVRQAVRLATQQSMTEYERHTVIPAAAEMLSAIQDNDDACALLTREIKQTKTPWYYYSTLAAIKKEQGKIKEALAYSQLARQSAEGRATRLQWITNDLFMSVTYAKDDNRRLTTLITEYYTLATTLPDGFSGRNQLRAQKVMESLKPLMTQKELHDKVHSFVSLCEKQTGESKINCQKHFEALL